MTEVSPRQPGRVFLSYRRQDTEFPAAWLFERLVSHFGREAVFKDVDSVDLGDDFTEIISSAVASCDVLLGMIGRDWVTITDEVGRRRLDDPNDFVRLEIETALRRDVRVIPILVQGAKLPRVEQLPDTLAKLVRRQALELSPNRFEYDTTRLLRVLDKTIGQQQARGESGGQADSVAVERAVGQQDAEGAEAERRRQVAAQQAHLRQLAQAQDWAQVLAVSARLAELDPAAADPEGLATAARERFAATKLEQAQAKPAVTRLHTELARHAQGQRWGDVLAVWDRIKKIQPGAEDPGGIVATAREQMRLGREAIRDAGATEAMQTAPGRSVDSGAASSAHNLTARTSRSTARGLRRDSAGGSPDAPPSTLPRSAIQAKRWMLAGLGVVGLVALALLVVSMSLRSQGGGSGVKEVSPTLTAMRTLTGHADKVWSVAVTPNQHDVVSSSRDETVRVWDLSSGRLLRTLTGHTGSVGSVAVTPNGSEVVSGSGDRTVRVWNLATGRLERTLTGHTDQVYAVAVTPDGQEVVSGSIDKTVRVWNLATGRLERTLTGHTNTVGAVAVTPDGRHVVSGSRDRTIRVWNLATGRLERTLTGHTNSVYAVAVTPDGQEVVSGSFDKTVRVWNLATGRLERTLTGHTDVVHAVAVTPNGQEVISGSGDRTVRVWDLGSGRPVQVLTGHTDQVHAVAVTPDGRQVISGSYDKTIRLWDWKQNGSNT